MSKFYGELGFCNTENVGNGVWKEKITLRKYFGDIERISKRFQNSVVVNEDTQLNFQLSIVADEHITNNYTSIKFIRYRGSDWKVSTMEFNRPRIILVLGGGLYISEES
jgi:hypothetical protein